MSILRGTCPGCAQMVLRDDERRTLSHPDPACDWWTKNIINAEAEKTVSYDVRDPVTGEIVRAGKA